MKWRNDYWEKKKKKLVRNIVFITACGAGDLATSSPEGMGPDSCGRQRTAPGRVAVLTKWHQKGARCLAPDETA